MTKRILIAEDHPMVRRGIVSHLKAILPDVLIHEAGTGIDVIKLAKRNSMDLFILDYRMPGMDGYLISKELLRKDPACKIIILTTYSSNALELAFFDLGVNGFISKTGTPEALETCIKNVLAGKLYYQGGEAITGNLTPAEHLPAVQFTLNEINLVKQLASGMTTQQIASNMRLSPKSIETYRTRLFEKAKVKNTGELISYMYKIGQLEV